MNTIADDTLRPAKRRKKENGEPPFFLDSFPKEVLDNVLRYTSGIPNAQKWEMHLDLRNLMELSSVRGELGSFIKSRFKTLCVSTTKDGKRESIKYKWDELDGHHLWRNKIADARKYILAGGGESLETLVLGDFTYKRKRNGKHLINDFVEHCPNVTSLSVIEKGSSWVNAFGKQLEKLELRTDFPIKFPVYSTKLREFTLSLDSDGDIPADLWRRIGSSLEKLDVHNVWLSESEDIKKNCRNLKNISLRGKANKDKNAIANLLASYGLQLEHALLYRMDEVHLKEVADACPKARFRLETFNMDRLFAGLNMLGPRLESITSKLDYGITENADGWKNAWDRASTLGKLEIGIRKAIDTEAIFSTPKEHLKELFLRLKGIDGAEDVKKVMDVCAKGTKCLETLSFFGPEFCRDSAKNLFEQNKYSLASIGIFHTVSAGDKKLGELVNSFLELPALEIVYLNYTVPINALKALEKRGVYVH